MAVTCQKPAFLKKSGFFVFRNNLSFMKPDLSADIKKRIRRIRRTGRIRKDSSPLSS
jgi:hypothetical protein